MKFLDGPDPARKPFRLSTLGVTCTNVLPPHRGGAVPSPIGMAGQISRGARPKGRPHCFGLFFRWAAR